MDLNEFKLFLCSMIGIDTTRSTVNINFKYEMSGQLLAFPIEDDKTIDDIREHSKSTQIPSLELYIEEVPSGNLVASNPSPTPMHMLTQETQNSFVLFPSCTPSPLLPNQVSVDVVVNLRESNEVAP